MISKRRYLSIVLIFLATLLLFQGSQLGREYWGSEQANAYSVETGLRSGDVWTPAAAEEQSGLSLTSGRPSWVLYAGDASAPEAAAAAQWADYAKLELRYADEPPGTDDELPALTLIGGEDAADHVPELQALLSAGGNVLILTMPALSVIRENDDLAELLGIRSIRRESVTLRGMHLFEGFLLGGERIYAPEEGKEEEEKRQDLPLETAWYTVSAGSEVFMQGILSEADEEEAEAEAEAVGKEYKTEENPAILWRYHRANGEVFVVNAPFMSNRALAAGILQAVMAAIQDTCIYPVLDAQLFSLIDYPAFSDENSAVIQSLYGRDMTDVTRNIILQDLVSLPNHYGIRFTGFAAPQEDHGDDILPRKGLAESLLKSFRSLDAELGLSLRRADAAPLAEAFARDMEYLSAEDPGLTVTSAFLPADALGEWNGAAALPEGLRTVLTEPDADEPPLGYLSENVTLQRMTCGANTHTYMQDLELLARETSLGYDSAYFDLSGIWRPETDEDVWQVRAEEVLSNLITFRAPFAAFDHVTASECDAKLRRYLNLDYDYSRIGDDITLLVQPLLTEASFVLRLYGETVETVEGGEFTKLEDGAFLLRVTQGYVTIHVAPDDVIRELYR